MAQGTYDPACTLATRSLGHRFRVAWRSAGSGDSRPSIQEYLNTIPESERSTALEILLSVELECRQEIGEQPTPQDYYSLFPDEANLIRSVFVGMQLLDARPTTPKPSGAPTPEAMQPGAPDSHPTLDYDSSGGVESPAAETPSKAPETGKRKTGRTGTPEEGQGDPPAEPGDLPAVSGYEILEMLGKGGMGVVYKARHVHLQRLVALKMILPGQHLSQDSTYRERFRNEARSVAQFQHPHLVQIYEVGEHDGLPYFSLELLEGGSLNQKTAGTPQSAAEAATLVETLARAVNYAHQKGVVHRDLKPSNILLMTDGTPKVADFGLAKQMDQDSGHTEEGGILGTPSYMAPEQAWGLSSAAGPAADIYALGAILYEMLTGRPPFKAATKWETVQLVRNQEPVPPRRLVPQVPRDLELICLKCLQKEPLQRFPRALDLAEELRRFLDGRPIRTRPTPLWEQAWKFARRRPAVASLIAVSVIALTSLVLYLDQRARIAQRDLDEQVRILDLRAKVQQLHLQAQEATDRSLLKDAQGHVQTALEIMTAEPALADLKPALDSLQTEVHEKQQAEAVYLEFFQFRDEALFHGMVFTGVELPANVAVTKSACQNALAVFGVTRLPTSSPEGRGAKEQVLTFPKHFSTQRRQQCAASCYELLLIWAEAEAQPRAGQQAPTRSQLDEALQLLDRAEQISSLATVAYHLRRARYLQLLGKAEDARREEQLGKDTEPSGALDYFLTGDSHQRQGQLEEAASDFANALRAQPDHFWARYFLAICNLQLQRPAQARDNLTACISSRPELPWLHLFRGFAHGQLNEYRAAEGDYQRALTLQKDPRARYGILVNQGVLRMRQAKQAASLVPLSWPLPRTPNLGFVYQGLADVIQQERLAAATDLLKQAIQMQSKQYPAYRYLALVLQQQQRLDEAMKQTDTALEAAQQQGPSVHAQLHSQRARIHWERNELNAALDELDQAIRAFPTADDYAERGRILFIRRQYSDAVTAYDAALALNPGRAEVYLGKADALLALHRFRDAAAALDQFVARGGKLTTEVYRTRGLIRARQGQFSSALSDYSQALTFQPDAATYTARGWVLLANDLALLALQDFEEALRLDPRKAEAYAGRGLIRVRQGQYTQALADASAAQVHGHPETARLLWNTAHIYAQLLGRLVAEPSAQNPRIGLTRDYCHDQALSLLRRALERVPHAERTAFWRQYVAADALLNPVRGSPGFEKLERTYAKKNELTAGP